MVALWLLLGLMGAAAYIAVGERVGGVGWWAAGLMVAAFAYVAFAWSGPVGGVVILQTDGGTRTGRDAVLAIEAAGAGLYALAAGIGWWRRSRRLLALAWTLHPLWDVGAHVLGGLPAPEWYVWACLSFDLAVGTRLWVRAPASNASTLHG